MFDLAKFQRDVLYVIAGEPGIHGLGVKAELDDYYDGEINHGRLYPNLDALVRKGLVAKSERDQRTNEYRLTDRGERELTTRREWEDDHASDLLEGRPIIG